MAEKKTLTEEQLSELSEDLLNKVSGGLQTGDICPECGAGLIAYDRNTDRYSCSVCPFYYNPSSH